MSTKTTLHSPDFASHAAPKPRAVLNHVGAKKLAGKIAVITGGSTGMGLATAKRFVLEGARIMCSSLAVARTRWNQSLLKSART